MTIGTSTGRVSLLCLGWLIVTLGSMLEAKSQSLYGDPLPSTLINGDAYPTPETTINGWINFGGPPDMSAIASHGWGLWAALTTPTSTPVPGFEGGRIYNTWLSPEQVRDLPSAALTASVDGAKSSLTLTAPAQFARIPQQAMALMAEAGSSPVLNITESVAYSPAAAQHAHSAQLLKTSTLSGLQKPGQIAKIPDFPFDAMAVKPVFAPITQASLENGLFKMAAWPGTPSPPEAFPSNKWGQCVYVDPSNNGSGNGSVDPTCSNPTPETTYNLSDFITLTVTDAKQIGLATESGDLQPGDFMILVGMHVSTREITQWTWQSFWWTPNPEAPHSPSDAVIAAARPSGLEAPANHYAMTTAYMMVLPAQPVEGGENVGEPLAAYNPHLEAPFPPSVFSIKRPINGTQITEYGVQSNCMTCHAMANYGGSSTKLGYGADFYIGRDDPAFIDSVQTDFLWSIPDTAN